MSSCADEDEIDLSALESNLGTVQSLSEPTKHDDELSIRFLGITTTTHTSLFSGYYNKIIHL